MGDWGEVAFSEDLYGSLKRVAVFRQWVDEERRRRGSRGLSILDFGCGTGQGLAGPLASGGDRVHGVDSHLPSIEWARAHVPGPTFSTESLEDLHARGARYEVVMCSEVLEHLENPAAHLRAIHAVLEPEGLLLVTVPNGYGPFENLKRLDRLLHRAGIGAAIDHLAWRIRSVHWRLRGRGTPPRPGEPVQGAPGAATLNPDSPHIQFFRLHELAGLFRETGFTLETQRSRVFLCGPYVDFWAPLVSFGGRLYSLNAAVADRLPPRWAADWMFRSRRS